MSNYVLYNTKDDNIQIFEDRVSCAETILTYEGLSFSIVKRNGPYILVHDGKETDLVSHKKTKNAAKNDISKQVCDNTLNFCPFFDFFEIEDFRKYCNKRLFEIDSKKEPVEYYTWEGFLDELNEHQLGFTFSR